MTKNEVDETLNGWVIALVAGKYFLGKLNQVGPRHFLMPVYEVGIIQLQIPTQDPTTREVRVGIQSQRTVSSILHLDSWTVLSLRTDAVVKPVSELDETDRAALADLAARMAAAAAEREKKAREEKLAKEAASTASFGGGARS